MLVAVLVRDCSREVLELEDVVRDIVRKVYDLMEGCLCRATAELQRKEKIIEGLRNGKHYCKNYYKNDDQLLYRSR